jgi:hypothetical protein
VTAAVIGWFTSWVIEAVNWPTVATRLTEAIMSAIPMAAVGFLLQRKAAKE